MDTMITYERHGIERNLLISKINYVCIVPDRNIVSLSLTGFDDDIEICFYDQSEAAIFYQDCLAKIEAYYKAMMPQKNDSAWDNAVQIRIAHEHEKRAYETVSKLANFISMLCQQTMGDCEIAPTHLEDKMQRLEQWVRNKAQEGK